MNCSRCTTPLNPKIIKELHQTIEVDVCPTCEGTWLDEGELSPLEKVIEPVLWESRKLPKSDAQLERLPCPKSSGSQWLKKAEHPRDAQVIMDYCENCKGIWLDKGEIKAIQQEHWLKTIFGLFGR